MLPEYFPLLLATSILVVCPPTVLVQVTEVACGVPEIVQPSVRLFVPMTEMKDVFETVTVKSPEIK